MLRLGRMYSQVVKSKDKAIQYYKQSLTLAHTIPAVPFNAAWLKVIFSIETRRVPRSAALA